jgi:serine phosphatase RsbU (regulator of sigma subunit)
VRRARQQSARLIVDAIFDAVQDFRGDTPPNDDMTAVVLKITS